MTTSRWLLPALLLSVSPACGPGEELAPTPIAARQDALSTGVVISQVYGAGGGCSSEGQSLVPFGALLLGALRSRRRRS